MKQFNKLIVVAAVVLCAAACVDLSPIQEDIRDLQTRMTSVERMCQGYNTSIEALQTALEALSEKDFVTSATEVKEGETIIGYTLVFKSGKTSFIKCGLDGADGSDGHSPIIGVRQDTDGIWYWTIDGEWLLDGGSKVQAVGRDGEDGEDGTDGKDGEDGHSPVIGMKQDTDGIWYWTIDGEWLLDGGSKVQAVGRDGEDGEDGQDGQDGHSPVIGMKQDTDGIWYWTIDGEWLLNDGSKVQAVGRDGEDGEDGTDGEDGADGKDGITPKLKVENGFWWVSYDNGVLWNQICSYVEGSSTPSVFSAVDLTSDDFVILTLTGGGTITLPRYKTLSISFSPAPAVVVDPGESAVVTYTIVGAGSETVVKALGQDGWSAKVAKASESSGTITITASAAAVSSEIVILVNDGDRTIISSVACTVNEVGQLFTGISVPGLYSISGDMVTATIFTPEDCWQKALRTMPSGVMFRATSLKQGATVSVSFLSNSLSTGAQGTVKVSSIGVAGVTDGTSDASILKKFSRMIWIADNKGRGYIIETE